MVSSLPRFSRGARLACLIVASGAVLGLSCSSGFQPVAGRVLYKGQPIKGAVVTLHPKNALDNSTGQRPSGITDEQGNFTLGTGKENGAPPGEYIVTIIWLQKPPAPAKPHGTEPPPDATDQFLGRYADAKKSKLTVSIQAGVNQMDPIQLE